MRVALLLSGGIDSTVTLAELRNLGHEVDCLVFDYGQTLHSEIYAALSNARRYGAEWYHLVLPMPPYADSVCSILGHGTDIASGRTIGEIQAGGTPGSYVPFRNGIFLAYAAAFAEAAKLDAIACGGNGLASGNYPDDTLEFAQAMERAIEVGTAPGFKPPVLFPNAARSKAAVVARGVELGVDFTKTTSCYRDGPEHCGTCDSCVQRIAAMDANGLNLNGEPK